MKDRTIYADDDTESISFLFKLRAPSLVLGLLLGVGLSFIVSRFDTVLAENIAVAYFIPVIVYLADAIGTQTQSIYTRDLRSGKASFKKYLFKETGLGLLFGLIFGAFIFPVVLIWLESLLLAFAVSIAVFGAIASAPIVALGVTEILKLEHSDPAVGAGPIATVIQDTLSVIIYGLIASAIIL